MTSIAYCWRDGTIDVAEGSEEPEGSLVITTSVLSVEALCEVVQGKARHGYKPGVYLVPGVPEAETDKDAADAVIRWRDWAFPKSEEVNDGCE